MIGSSRNSVGVSARYTVLAANVSKVLDQLSTRDIDPVEQKLMDRAADLLRTIAQGTTFVEGKDAHALSHPTENLFTATHALAALKNIYKDGEAKKQVTQVFEDLEQDLRKLARGDRLAAKHLQTIAKFFDALGKNFYRDVANSSVTRREPIFERP